MWSIYTFMRRIEDLVASRLQFTDQVMIGRSDKLTSEQPHGSRVAITPAPISLICEAPVT
jgi:hypothetical protein